MPVQIVQGISECTRFSLVAVFYKSGGSPLYSFNIVEALVWDSIKSFSKVQQDNIALLAMIKVSSKIFEGDEQFGFTRMRFEEAMLDIRHDLELFQVGHNVTKYKYSMILRETEMREIGL